MNYEFYVTKSSQKPKRERVCFRAVDDDAAYRWVVQEILLVPGNTPLQEGYLYRRDQRRHYLAMMKWVRGSGWEFPSGDPGADGLVDHRVAPGG